MKHCITLRYACAAAVVLLVGLSNVHRVNAQSIWDGGSVVDSNWSTPANWAGDVAPPNNGSDVIQFAGSTRLTPNTDVAWQLTSLTYNAGAGAFVNGGMQLTIGSGGITNNAVNIETINNDIVLSNTQAWTAATGNLMFGGAVNLAVNTLTVTGASNTTMNGVLSGTGNLTKSGTGTLTLGADNTGFGGSFTVTAGTLMAAVDGALPDGVAYTVNGGTLNLNNFNVSMSSLSGTTGGTVSLGSAALTVNQNGNTTYSGIITGTGSLTKDGTGRLILGGANSYSGGTTVTAGVLEGTTTSLQHDILDNATVDFNQSFTGTYSGSITGTGNVIKDGTGTVILTGMNNYSGGTTVNDGTLQGDTTSLKGDINTTSSTANVTFNQTADGAYNNVISGSGSVTKTGTNSLTFNQPQTYTGGTNINQGSLILGANDVLADSGNVTLNGGTLDINTRTDTVAAVNLNSGTITGSTGVLTGTAYNVQAGSVDSTLAGSGALTKTGAGTVTLSKSNTYTGGTNVNGGTLSLTASNVLADSGIVNVNGGILAMGANNDTVGAVTLTSGSITGTGTLTGSSYAVQSGTVSANLGGGSALTKTTAGTVTLSGGNNIGVMTVSDGRLDITGTTNTTSTTVSGTGILAGTGTVGGTVNNNGTVSAGTMANPTGTLTFSGHYNAGSGTTEVNITPGSNSNLIVDSATLSGGTVNVVSAAGTYNAGQKFTFLNSSTNFGSNNQFDSITDDIDGLDAVLGYTNNSAFFTLLRNGQTYAAIGQTRNQKALGRYLDLISSNATGDMQTVFDSINNISNAQARLAFNQLDGAVHGTLGQIGVQNTTLVIQQIGYRLRSAPFAAGNDDDGSGPECDVGPTDVGANGKRGGSAPISLVSCNADGSPCCDQCPCPDDGHHCCCNGWVQGFGLGGSATSDGNVDGLTYAMGGTVGGAERWVDDGHLFGFWGGYIGSTVQTSRNQNINGGQFGGYLFSVDCSSYSIWLGGFEFDGYNTERQLAFGDINRLATANYDGWQAFGYWERGVTYGSCNRVLQPFVALQYLYLRQNGFTEAGANSVDLVTGGLDTWSFRSMLGARFQYAMYARNGKRFLPEVHALWMHEYLNSDTVLTASFAGGGTPGAFAVNGLDLGRDWAMLGASTTWELGGGWSMFVNYDCQTNSQQTFHVGSGGLGHMW